MRPQDYAQLLHHFQNMLGLVEWKKTIIVWLRDHNGGKNYDVIENEIFEIGANFRAYFYCQN